MIRNKILIFEYETKQTYEKQEVRLGAVHKLCESQE